MNHHTIVTRALTRALLPLVLLTASWTSAHAQSAAVDLWVPQVEEFADVERAELEAVFTEALGGPHGDHHIVGVAGIESAIEARGFDLPDCLEGRDVCSSPLEAALAGLGANRVIYASAREEGTVIHLTVVDVELGRRVELEIRGEDLRATVFQAVGSVTDASATLSITSLPPGAEVRLDGVLLGTTPYTGTLGVGSYDLSLRTDGYYEYTQELELRANDYRDEEIEMERRYALLTIESNAPGTQVIVDGETTHEADAPIELLPGTRELEIIAPGYDSDQRTIQVVAGEERSYRLTMVESAETLARRKHDEILAHPFTLQLGAFGGGFRTSWNNARVQLHGDRARVGCPVDESDVTAGCVDNTPVGLLGADLTALFDWKWLEVQLAGLAFRRSNLRSDRTTYRVNGRPADLVEGRGGIEILLRLPGAGVRWQLDEDWSLALRTAPAIAFQRVNSDRVPGGDDVPMRRTDWLWEVHMGGRYHISSSLYTFAEANAGFILDHSSTRARLGATVGIGFHFEDPFGVQFQLEQNESERNAPAPPTPGEL